MRAFVHCLATGCTDWLPFADGAAETGCILALAIICFVQYGYHVYYVVQSKKRARLQESALVQLTAECQELEKNRLLVHVENQILREFVSSADIQKACRGLLKSFAPNPSRQFAACLRLEESRLVIEEARGLSKTTLRDWKLTTSDLKVPAGEEFLCLKGRDLRKSELWLGLSTEDRRKTEELFFFPITASGQITGGFITTSLHPATAARTDQIGLVQRIVSGLGGTLQQRLALKAKAHELRSTEELLELRSLTDQLFASPLDMVQAYVSKLQSMLEADAAILFLRSSERQSPGKPMVRCLGNLNERLWPGLEDGANIVLRQFTEEHEFCTFDKSALKDLGIDSVMRSALLVPLRQNQQLSGVLCFARRAETGFDPADGQFAICASEHLGNTLVCLQSLADIKRLAGQDGLTDLANRRTFDERLNREIRVAHRAKMPCSLLLCDLDRFKSINDTHGHLAGDEVLKAIARILQQEALKTPAGERALTARFGGEELAIILPGQGEEVAVRVAEEIRNAVFRETVWWRQMPIRVSISIGASTFPAHGVSAEALIASADAALYLAKDKGRNRVSFPPMLAPLAGAT